MKLDYHGDRVIVEPRGNVRIQTQTPAQGILSTIGMFRQLPRCELRILLLLNQSRQLR